MEYIFIRHGHGEHLLDYPNRLNALHPGLTGYGKMQVHQLGEQLNILPDDLILVSPTKRTIETAAILTKEKSFMISPFVGPRMFPQNPELPYLDCDRIYTKAEVTRIINEVKFLDFGVDCWEEGINIIDQALFEEYARQLISWCQGKYDRVIIISHDGTITNYRTLLGEQGLTREDFLGEAGLYRLNI